MGITIKGWKKRRQNGLGIAWNKGKKLGPLTEEHKNKIRKTHKKNGLVPPSWKGKKRSPESVEKSASKRRGIKRPEWGKENCNFWKGGITPINAKIRTSLEYKLWRKACFVRDNFTCQITGKSGRDIIVHHINNFADFPELRLAIDNGFTMCKEYHNKFHQIYGKHNNTREQLNEFIEKYGQN